MNEIIRQAAVSNGVRLWEIAERLGLNDGNFSRKLRRKLSPEETNRVLQIINDIHADHAKGGDHVAENKADS